MLSRKLLRIHKKFLFVIIENLENFEIVHMEPISDYQSKDIVAGIR